MSPGDTIIHLPMSHGMRMKQVLPRSPFVAKYDELGLTGHSLAVICGTSVAIAKVQSDAALFTPAQVRGREQ